MSVRRSLLAILDQGPCYGYQLRAEYARRTGAALNVGQIYTTLDRLERDGMVEKRGTDDRGHTYWGITADGREDARRWFKEPEAPGGRDEQAFKVALAATLPGVDVAGLIAAERAAAEARLARLDADRVDAARADAARVDAADVPAAILRAAERARTAAEVAWLDAAAALLTDAPAPHVVALSEERPRRGRPVRS